MNLVLNAAAFIVGYIIVRKVVKVAFNYCMGLYQKIFFFLNPLISLGNKIKWFRPIQMPAHFDHYHLKEVTLAAIVTGSLANTDLSEDVGL